MEVLLMASTTYIGSNRDRANGLIRGSNLYYIFYTT